MRNPIFITVKMNKKLLIIFITFITALFVTILYHHYISKSVFYYSLDRTIVIDPGHGGIDAGTCDASGLLEKDINLNISLKLKKVLKNKHYKVIMTREKDISLENMSSLQSSRYRKDLDARKKIINRSNADLFVSIHANAYPEDLKARGIKIFYFPSSKESKELAKSICTAINDTVYKKFLNDKNIKAEAIPEDYYVLRETKIPGILIETGFITNSIDKKLLKSEKYKTKIAEAIGYGIIQYFKNK